MYKVCAKVIIPDRLPPCTTSMLFTFCSCSGDASCLIYSTAVESFTLDVPVDLGGSDSIASSPAAHCSASDRIAPLCYSIRKQVWCFWCTNGMVYARCACYCLFLLYLKRPAEESDRQRPVLKNLKQVSETTFVVFLFSLLRKSSPKTTLPRPLPSGAVNVPFAPDTQ